MFITFHASEIKYHRDGPIITKRDLPIKINISKIFSYAPVAGVNLPGTSIISETGMFKTVVYETFEEVEEKLRRGY